ncbi:abortive infection family protein [Flavobacterium sp. ST-87]|uniref:Abortive infection family protein n=1 Tax=Flavobacterium plantiphilum TaxID=3163297 RepID=A0ABW8XNX1_9FLAO
MEDEDIKKLKRILEYNGRRDLSELFINSISYLDQTNTFGSRWNSWICYLEIKSPLKNQVLIDKLSDEDKKVIFDAVLQIYPSRNNEPEIVEIIYLPNFEQSEDETIDTKELDRISFEYIRDQIKKCNKKIIEEDFEGSITNARTLIESICLFIIESKNGYKYDYDGNLLRLYKKTSEILNMSPQKHDNESLKQILSGIISIINGVTGLRNSHSDSHGSGPLKKEYKIDQRHAVLTVNVAKTISEYLFLSFEKTTSA